MLSGIGMQADLHKNHIPVFKELPVGLNLQDHVTTGMDLVLLNTTLDSHPTRMLTLSNLWNYFINGNGILTHGGCEAIGFSSSKGRNLTETPPDIGYLVLPFGASTTAGLQVRKILNVNDKIWEDYFSHFTEKSVVTVLPILLHPKSRGKITLASNNPFDAPLIDPQYLTRKDDITTLVKGLNMLKQLLKSDDFKKFDAELNPRLFPGCEGFEFASDAYWECYIKHLTLTMYHPVGSCPMGKDPYNSVVDYRFKVHGVDNLYIADASVMPNHVSGNPNAAIAMLAQKFVSTLK